MSAPKRKAPTMKAKQVETVNKRALVWIGSIVGIIIVGMALLLILT
ncbi:hypothetical protein PaecuDRAFT_0186 [Paenibacillus curdlanolyticus YK9]|uniref:Uncharacterized protein n=1 Tax=Paenibacillus curdlanolyticus YK9 TaxID=717606 RepID=E0I311_9BACL|nr:hypothetical protein [Paenibacillus curdlanolyticus]EFM12675.1 hypothetical protein PaecuDRAFT_0186 [Paenibacillus curdlanolyticus YK9]